MKTQFRKVTPWRGPKPYVYELVSRYYHRPIRTFQELRRNGGDRTDHRDVRLNGVRGRRNNNVLNAWNDLHRERDYKRSWKDFTKHRKQWEVGFDPKPVDR